MNILVICATDESIGNNKVKKFFPIIKRVFPDIEKREIRYFYNNVYQEHDKRPMSTLTPSSNKCLVNLLGSDNISEDLFNCYSKRDMVFDIIILEHCSKLLNSTKMFDNLSRILNPESESFILLHASKDMEKEGINEILEIIKLLERSATKNEILYHIGDGIDDLDLELESYYDSFFNRMYSDLAGKKNGLSRKRGTGTKGATRDMLLAYALWLGLSDIIDSGITLFDGENIKSIDQFNLSLNPLGLKAMEVDNMLLVHKY